MSNQELVAWEPNPQEMDIYRRHFAPASTTDTEWEIFLEVCRVYRVSPLKKQIYLIGRWDSAKKRMVNTPQISIGGLRGLAIDTHEFEGTTEPQWGDEEGNWYSLWPKRLGNHPYAARIGVYRHGFRSPVWGVAYFDEMAQYAGKGDEKRLTQFWETKGRLMILKCAEAAGLRAAFEERCGGLYIHEEMNQADADAGEITIIPADYEDEALQETATHRSTHSAKAGEAAKVTVEANYLKPYPPTGKAIYNAGKLKGMWSDSKTFFLAATAILDGFLVTEKTVLTETQRDILHKAVEQEQQKAS